jgi:hypothetical protein
VSGPVGDELAERAVRPVAVPAEGDYWVAETAPETIARCCAGHEDWPTLTDHLVRDFDEVAYGDIIREVVHAKEAVEIFGVAESERLAVAEVLARHQLMLRTGRVSDIARLSPERHRRSRDREDLVEAVELDTSDAAET